MGQRLGARSRAATSVSGPASRVHPSGKQVRLVGREFEETRNKERAIERVGKRERGREREGRSCRRGKQGIHQVRENAEIIESVRVCQGKEEEGQLGK